MFVSHISANSVTSIILITLGENMNPRPERKDLLSSENPTTLLVKCNSNVTGRKYFWLAKSNSLDSDGLGSRKHP